jgi:cardiolipin synthase (CMP-forming)
MFTTLSNQLTFARLVAIPVICICLTLPGAIAAWVALILFVAAAITDYFDGYFARARSELTTLGRVLDPIADKLLVSAVLLMLVFNGRIGALTVIPALVILLREVAVSGLREFLAELRVSLPVSRLAKWKTAIQMTAIPFLIVADYPVLSIPAEAIGIILFWIAGVLTVITGWDYWQARKKHVLEEN